MSRMRDLAAIAGLLAVDPGVVGPRPNHLRPQSPPSLTDAEREQVEAIRAERAKRKAENFRKRNGNA